MCFDAAQVSDNENESDSDNDDDDDNVDYVRTQPLTTDYSLTNKSIDPNSKDYNNNNMLINIIEDEEDHQKSNHASEFLQWHHRLGHISPKKIKEMSKQGILPSYLQNCNVPICTSCVYGKMTRKPWRTKSSNNNTAATSTTKMKPGECVSIDQLESTTPGLIGQLKGIPTKARYKAATIFIDHATRFTYVHLQQSTNAEETIMAKKAFESVAANYGIRIWHYHADNGRFAENRFKESIQQQGQTISFCGVNAHFQNGMAERKIRDLQEHSRTMLIHASKRWPKAINTNLWPYALRMSNDILNESPNMITGKIPINDFSGSQIASNPKHWHSFGCPIYILDNDIQGGKKIDKWSDRAKIGINLGRSPQHAKNVYLALSLTTGLVSPQFHVKHDDKFETLRTIYGNNPPPSQWQEKCHFIDVNINPIFNPKITGKKRARSLISNDIPVQSTTTLNDANTEPKVTAPINSIETIDPLKAPEGGINDTNIPVGIPNGNRYLISTNKENPTSNIVNNYINKCLTVPYEAMATFIDSDYNHEIYAHAASKDPDIMYLHEAQKQPDWPKFQQAMKKEVDGQMSNGNLKLIHIDDVPKGATILPAVWAMRRKRRIDTNEIYKWKARLNIDGSKQTKGINYWETYAPVASWSVIRILLIMIIIKKWKTRQIDYVQAYTQAKAEIPMFMKIPKGFNIENGNSKEYVLSVQKNLYGQKQAGRVWNQHLIEKLQKAGFRQSIVDECVFYVGECIYILYVDDSILAGPTDEALDKAIQDIKDVGLEITVESKVDEFLGVKISQIDDETYNLTQPQLIQQILQDLHMQNDNVKVKHTPASPGQVLRQYQNSNDFDDHYDYRSIVGKLNYLEKSSRPDISFAVHQCARFVSNPKEEHSKAIKHLGRYLKNSKEKGIQMKPDPTRSLECYVDADFSGNWNKEEAQYDSNTARSRTGFIIMYAGCPLVWASKLQSHIALSSTEAEYIAMSTAMREIVPLMSLLEEMVSKGFLPQYSTPTIQCKMFEDNSGAIEIAKVKKYRPRTKHINTQYHHFRQYVDEGKIIIEYINTKDQLADLLTKSLPTIDIERLRKRLLGW
jgi:hypothetical protein